MTIWSWTSEYIFLTNLIKKVGWWYNSLKCLMAFTMYWLRTTLATLVTRYDMTIYKLRWWCHLFHWLKIFCLKINGNDHFFIGWMVVPHLICFIWVQTLQKITLLTFLIRKLITLSFVQFSKCAILSFWYNWWWQFLTALKGVVSTFDFIP